MSEDFQLDLAADLDFLSERPSQSLPNIHFGSDSEDSSDHDEPHKSQGAEAKVSTPVGTPRMSRTDSADPASKLPEEKTLYIQMEFVDGRNLREVRLPFSAPVQRADGEPFSGYR